MGCIASKLKHYCRKLNEILKASDKEWTKISKISNCRCCHDKYIFLN